MHRINLNFVGIAMIFLIALSIFSPTGVADVDAQENLNHLLQGDYLNTGIQHCILAAGGFDEDTLEPSDVTATQDSSFTGTLHFDGKGNVSFKGSQLAITKNVDGTISAGEATFNCNGTYAVNPDRSFVLEYDACPWEVVRPAEPTVLGETIGIKSTGRISVNGLTTRGGITSYNVQTLNITYPDYDFTLTTYRICNASATSSKTNAK